MNTTGCFESVFFHGYEKPKVAEIWLINLKGYIALTQCSDSVALAIAKDLLKDDALSWWLTVEKGLESASTVATYGVFKAVFEVRWVTDAVTLRNEIEFRQLKQEDSTIGEYLVAFKSKLEQLPHIANNSEEVCRCFIWGLHPLIYMKMFQMTFISFEDFVDQALRVETEVNGGVSLLTPENPLAEVPPQETQMIEARSNNYGTKGKEIIGETSIPTFFQGETSTASCSKCGENHSTINCPIAYVRCWICGQQ